MSNINEMVLLEFNKAEQMAKDRLISKDNIIKLKNSGVLRSWYPTDTYDGYRAGIEKGNLNLYNKYAPDNYDTDERGDISDPSGNLYGWNSGAREAEHFRPHVDTSITSHWEGDPYKSKYLGSDVYNKVYVRPIDAPFSDYNRDMLNSSLNSTPGFGNSTDLNIVDRRHEGDEAKAATVLGKKFGIFSNNKFLTHFTGDAYDPVFNSSEDSFGTHMSPMVLQGEKPIVDYGSLFSPTIDAVRNYRTYIGQYDSPETHNVTSLNNKVLKNNDAEAFTPIFDPKLNKHVAKGKTYEFTQTKAPTSELFRSYGSIYH